MVSSPPLVAWRSELPSPFSPPLFFFLLLRGAWAWCVFAFLFVWVHPRGLMVLPTPFLLDHTPSFCFPVSVEAFYWATIVYVFFASWFVTFWVCSPHHPPPRPPNSHESWPIPHFFNCSGCGAPSLYPLETTTPFL